ncbi:hypothetical protein RHSIM_Rhsim07G0070000 [Rhododendron simsii]|uniref:Uncharacterized protein n=1 Tax=Rhododendron simsii TaxID=118357 RepID=A0A834LIG3_RHOSS|nr:hypothetical protein RHSIM_Rhsim07G0070000 [Rhododendron simsii]
MLPPDASTSGRRSAFLSPSTTSLHRHPPMPSNHRRRPHSGFVLPFHSVTLVIWRSGSLCEMPCHQSGGWNTDNQKGQKQSEMAKQSHCAGGGDGLKAWEGGGATMWLMATRRLIGDQRLMRRAAAVAVINHKSERNPN